MKPLYIYITPFFPSKSDWRGAYCYDYVATLMAIGKYDVIVMKEGDGESYSIGDITVHTFPARRLPSNIMPSIFWGYNDKIFLRCLRRLHINMRLVAIVHANTASYGHYALSVKRLNPSCISLLHHHDPQSFGLNLGVLRHCIPYNMMQYLILRRMHSRMDCHVFVSNMCKRSFLRAPDSSWTNYEDYKRQMRGLPFKSVNVSRSIILHNGVRTDLFINKSSRNPYGVVIGCVGNFIEWKRQDLLIEAIRNIRDSKSMSPIPSVIFIGSGPRLEYCQCLSKEYGLDGTISFRQEIGHDQLVDFYNSINLFVLPSEFEGFGCVFTEAFACGVPFITCKGQGIEDLIPQDDRDAWLARIGDSEDLAHKIVNFFSSWHRQYLCSDYDIKPLVAKFIGEVENMRQEINSMNC